MRTTEILLRCVLGTLVLTACGPSLGAVSTGADDRDGEGVLTAAPENGTIAQELTAGVPIGSTLKTTSSLNLRSGPSTTNSIRLVLPSGAQVVTVNQATPTNSFYNVKYNGVTGWAHGSYLTLVSVPISVARTNAIKRAQGGVGFSYWWGHGKWLPNGATSTTIGSCTGDCPSCSHTGTNGADCSGYLGKVWQVPSGNTDPTVDSHPYSTVTFNGTNSQWSTISRGSVVLADALVYNQNGAGHIFLYESGDGWGSMWTYEARGCAYGIVHNLRTAGTEFKAIAHTGY